MANDETIITSFDSLDLGSEEKRPFISFIKGPRLGEIVPLDKSEMLVGRSQDCDLWVADNAISRHHFRLFIEKNQVVLEDLGSTNGTYVNGKQQARVQLNDGDRIQISKNTIMELAYLDESRSLSEKKVYEMGVKDAVTGIYNRRFFLDRLNEEFSFIRRRDGRLSLIMFDIDFFKKINDGHGHLAGDQVLKILGEEITKAIRQDDVYARYGGEEFAIIMRDTPIQSAMEMAERIRLLVQGLKVQFAGQIIPVTISSGVSSYHDQMQEPSELIAAADKCLYQSKQSGRNRVTGPKH